jgi:D-arginine dehydrogenase
MQRFDVIVIGGGVVGASLAWRLAPQRRVAIVEMERMSGYHSSGRSATYFNVGLGLSASRLLTLASRDFFLRPGPGFSEHPLADPLPALTVSGAAAEPMLEDHLRELRELVPDAIRLDAGDIARLVPLIRPSRDGIWAAILDPSAFRIDGHALLQGYIAGARARGAKVFLGSEAMAIKRAGGDWTVHAGTEELQAPVVVNAAGAWSDVVARRAGVAPVGLTPMRRTIVTFDAPAGRSVEGLPFVRSIEDRFYFTGESGGVLLSPADESPVEPHDAQPEDEDVAIAVDRFESVTGAEVTRIRSRWAGLRTFACDRVPVIGFDGAASGFFWCAGQGGVGLQTSPAASHCAASMILGEPWPAQLADRGLRAADLSPLRFRGSDPAPVATPS